MSEEKRLRVLVVDDLADAADSLACVLRLWGYTVAVSYDGRKVLEAACNFRPHAVLLDVGLPGMDGFRVARHLRESPQLGSLLIVGVTGYDAELYRVEAAASGFDEYLVKPVDLDLLAELLKQRIRGHRARWILAADGAAPESAKTLGVFSADAPRHEESTGA